MTTHKWNPAPNDFGGRTQQANQDIHLSLTAVREQVAQVVVGQDVDVERLLIALLTGGNFLLSLKEKSLPMDQSGRRPDQ